MKRLLLLLALLTTQSAQAVIKVAVASNFKQTLSEIAGRYKKQSGETVLISSASTGILYSQIKHGAPFDLFLAADSKRAKLIEQSKRGIVGSRFTYAQGKLAFWKPGSVNVTEQTLLGYKGRLAIANPQLAPYGMAAQQTLSYLQLWDKFTYIRGANVSQTYQFIDSGNIAAGFVAYSLLLQNRQTNYYLIPEQQYQAILQQGVLLSAATDKKNVQKFINYLTSDATKALIRDKGYR